MEIYVGNLHPNTTKKDVYNLFIQFGKVLSIELYSDAEGRNLGYGYLSIRGRIDGKRAIEQLNEICFMHYFLQVHEVKSE